MVVYLGLLDSVVNNLQSAVVILRSVGEISPTVRSKFFQSAPLLPVYCTVISSISILDFAWNACALTIEEFG